ncbi:MAG: SusC/RagA family TonB-linked outer membrane protein [Flavitalea sp.]
MKWKCPLKLFMYLSFLLVSLSVSAQQRTYSGKVSDATTLTPIEGVSILVKGKAQGTATDADGNFTITANQGDVLVVGSIGYSSREISLSQNETLSIPLDQDISRMEDVVVVGYGTQKKKDLTGAVSSLKIENSPLTLLPNANILDAIKGRIAGFDIGSVNTAGGNPSINIRGQNSIRASNTPLIVLDGVIFLGSFNEINPNDIATVDVLKDASSSAVYGSRAANGVILITTKRGKSGKPSINFRATTGIQTYTMRPDMREGEEFIKYRYDVKKMNGGSPADLEMDRLLNPKELQAYNEGKTIDWWDEVVKPAPFRDYQMNISGGSDRFNYYVSGNYMDQQGIVANDNFKKFTVFSKVEAQITDWLKYGLNLSVSHKNADGVAADLEKATINGPYGYMYSTFPGYENWYERYPQSSTTTFNPFWRTQTFDQDRNNNYRSLNYLNVNVPWVSGLTYTLNFAMNRWEGHVSQFNNERTFVNTLNENDLKDQSRYLTNANGFRNNSERTDWFLSHIVNYKQSFGSHSFDATLLAERQNEKTQFMRLDARDFAMAGTTVLGVNALELGNPETRTVNTNQSELSQLAYMARMNYVYRGRYHLSASIRKDGYSGFAVGNKYGTFKSLAAAYTISEENFFKNSVSFMNFLKLRASYGENGNPTIGAFATFPSVATSNYLFGVTPVNTIYANRLANRGLKWESTTAFNIGIDFGFFRNRISGNIDYYNSETRDLLLSRSIPVMNGFATVDANIGKVHNTGWEVQLSTKNVETKDFSWSSGFNFWMNRNEIKSLYGLDGNKDGIEDDDVANSWFIGKSLGAIYDYTWDGIVQTEDTAYLRIYGGRAGDIKFQDLNKNNRIDPGDRSIVGYTKPNYTLSFANTFTYKNFELYFLFNTIRGGGNDNFYLAGNQYAINPNTLYSNIANWLDKPYWTAENPSNSIPRPNYSNTYGYRFSQRHDFIRLQDLSFSYRVNQKILDRTPIKNLRVYMAGKNLLTITDWDGLDPETATTFASVNGFPVFKTVTFGIELGL